MTGEPITLNFKASHDKVVAYTPIGEFEITVMAHDISAPFYVQSPLTYVYASCTSLEKAKVEAQRMFDKMVTDCIKSAQS